MQSPFFSVILPTYNRANMIGRAIESVIAQTYTNWELLVVDDGSTDNTKQVVEAYNDSRIRYIYQQNAERSAARNNGIDNAKGEYVCFIDSDDYFLLNHLQEFINNLGDNPGVDMLFGLNVIDRNGVLTNEDDRKAVADYNSIEEYFVMNPVRVAAVCVKRQVLLKNKFDLKIRIGEDTELWVRIAAKHKIIPIRAFTQVYLMHDDQTVSNANYKSVFQHNECLDVIFKFDDNNNKKISFNVRKQALSYGYFKLGQAYLLSKKYSKGVSALLTSIIYEPGNRLKEKIYLIYSYSIIGPNR
jgi:glycosyltransferase involved in cell wall biosynthesis